MTPTDILRIARAIYGADAAWRDESEVHVYVRHDYGAITRFDPLTERPRGRLI